MFLDSAMRLLFNSFMAEVPIIYRNQISPYNHQKRQNTRNAKRLSGLFSQKKLHLICLT